MPPWLLPASIATALFLGVVFPGVGLPLALWKAGPAGPTDFLVALIFIIFGWRLSLASTLRVEKPALPRFLGAIFLNLGAAPLLAVLCISCLPLPAAWAVGLAVTACVPTSLSSAVVICRQAGGNERLSLLLTLWLNLIGVFLTPWTLSRVLHASTTGVPVGQLLARLACTVALPLALGALLRKSTGRPAPVWAANIPPLCVDAIVWLTASRYHLSLRSLSLPNLAGMSSTVVAFHLVLVSSAWFLFRSSSRPDRIALSITGAQKTLPLSVALLAAIPGTALGASLAFCVLHHFSQILLDSLWAIRLRSFRA